MDRHHGTLPGGEVISNDGWLLTPAVNVYLGGRNMLLTDLDVWAPSVGRTQYSFKTQLNFYF